MSLSTSKSKTQLAYARSSKAVNKPKNKNSTQIQGNELTKSKQPARNSTGNIYDSIMGQIDTTQQDYIKSLIVKNQKESIKNQREAQKQITKPTQSSNDQRKINVSLKGGKQTETSKKISLIQSHERTRSQADLLIKESLTNIQTKNQKQITEISCISEQQQNTIQTSQIKMNAQKQTNKKQQSSSTHYPAFSTTYPLTDKSDKINTLSNPIIQALNNTSSSFAKKIQAFELEYPCEEREQRSTHKKVSSKLTGEYFSCQTSPKNAVKNSYTKEIVITTKPQQASYNSTKNNEHQTTINSPISSVVNSNQKNSNKKLTEAQQVVPTNFLSSLDQYLDVLTLKSSENHYLNPCEYQQNNRPSKGNMKRSNSNKFKESSTLKAQFHQPFTLGKEEQEEQTIVLQNGAYYKNKNSKIDTGKLLTFGQQQKVIKSLEKQKKKVSEMKSIIDLFNQQLTKYKKKEKKMKQNQYHMIECLKTLNQELTEQRRQRRKLQEVVKQFQSKIRGISRGKDKKRRESIENEQKAQRKTIYGVSSTGNNIHYGQPAGNFYNHNEIIQRDASNKVQHHSKKRSSNRFSSVINNITQQYSRDILNEQQESQNYHIQKRSLAQEGFGKNRTQKISKIMSSFQLDDQEEMNHEARNMRNSIRKVYPPNSCKNSYLNSSLPASRQTKSRPMTPKIIQQLFKGNKKSRNQQSQQIYNHGVSNHNYDSESDNEEFSREYTRQQYHQEKNSEESSDSQSDFNPNQNYDDSSEFEERNDREYMQHNDVLIRMR